MGIAGLPLVACGSGGGDSRITPTAAAPSTPSPTPTQQPTPTATPTPSPTVIPPTPTATPDLRDPEAPLGFPLDPAMPLGIVRGDVGSREIAWGEGPSAFDYSRDDQPSDDPVRANRCGWNARVHVEYEGQPAADWYIPTGTEIVATHDGTATLLVNTVANPFDVYGVSREAYIGNPDRSRAPVSAFPGPGGGQGVFVRVENAAFRTDYAHLELEQTMPLVPGAAWLPGYAPGAPLLEQFVPLRDFRVATAVAQWPVRRGDVLGISGDSGYSEAPHLHYTIRRAGAANLLSPTAEPGFEDANWLFR